jgi:uncharacterized protein
MNALNFLDANVWLALLWSRHVHSERAREWFEGCLDERFFFCRFTPVTVLVLRLLTTGEVMGTDVRTIAGAWDLWDEVEADGRIEGLPEPNGFEEQFRVHSRFATASPKVWADGYLLAFASAAGVRLVTFDRAVESRAAEILLL